MSKKRTRDNILQTIRKFPRTVPKIQEKNTPMIDLLFVKYSGRKNRINFLLRRKKSCLWNFIKYFQINIIESTLWFFLFLFRAVMMQK